MLGRASAWCGAVGSSTKRGAVHGACGACGHMCQIAISLVVGVFRDRIIVRIGRTLYLWLRCAGVLSNRLQGNASTDVLLAVWVARPQIACAA